MNEMTAQELRDSFLSFFEDRGHKIVPSSSLVPADPTSLFTSAGMQQFVPYLSGESEPPYRRACSVQKCVRVNDVDEVGDSTHHTFFEMLGNWSFGDYFKKEAIDYALEFVLEELGMSKDRIWVTIFEGDESTPRDDESERLWLEKGIPQERIYEYDKNDNFWGPVTATGPCGPCTEIFYQRWDPCGPDCHPNCECGAMVEIWNLVFMGLDKKDDGSFEELSQHNVDTGAGFERLVFLLQGKGSAYQTDLFQPIIREIESVTGKDYEDNKRRFRVIADHLRASSFMITDRVRPSNTDRGYVLRMLLRRMFRHLYQLGGNYESLIEAVVDNYSEAYPDLDVEEIQEVIQREEGRFKKALDKGLKRFEEMAEDGEITGHDAFDLYQSYGFPLELTNEMAEEEGLSVDREEYEKAMKEHKEQSRKGAKKKFGGGELEGENKRKATALHTATHLLQAGLRSVLGDHVKQMGSDIKPERLRFDFSNSKALTDEQIEEVEEWVQDKINQGLKVSKVEVPYEEAVDSGALAFFKVRYPRKVFVYTIGSVSKEICAGPHIKSTEGMGQFEIIKEESVGAGVRRIKAILK